MSYRSPSWNGIAAGGIESLPLMDSSTSPGRMPASAATPPGCTSWNTQRCPSASFRFGERGGDCHSSSRARRRLVEEASVAYAKVSENGVHRRLERLSTLRVQDRWFVTFASSFVSMCGPMNFVSIVTRTLSKIVCLSDAFRDSTTFTSSWRWHSRPWPRRP